LRKKKLMWYRIMGEKRAKRKPTYKQMAFETAVRNPERYIEIFTALKDFEGVTLNDENLLKVVSHLYLNKIVTSDKIIIKESTNVDDISGLVEKINITRRADGGFPSGYASRFWTYMRTPSELGFVYARYNEPFKFSTITNKLINGDIDEQEAFSIQSIKYNRKNPYRNVSNDFNFFRFILETLIKLKENGKTLSYEQFIVAMFSKKGNVNEFLKIINKNKFKDFHSVFDFVKKNYKITTKEKTVTNDYPDVVRRLFIISGYISIRYSGKKLIQINENKLNYINELLKFDFSLLEEEKTDKLKYFNKLQTKNDELLLLVKKYRKEDIIDGNEYVNKIFDIIENYEINEKIITESIEKIGSKKTVIEEFKEIPEPLKLEFYISILIALKYGREFAIRPNYKADHIGKPYSHAPANKGDIEIFSKTVYWLVEVTLIRNKTQQLNSETTSIIRHLYSNQEFANRFNKYLSFIAPIIHEDVKDYFNYSIVQSKSKGYKVNLKPYSLDEFIKITMAKENFKDMESYTKKIFEEFKMSSDFSKKEVKKYINSKM